MNYFWDENLPPSLSRAISALHEKEFPADKVVSYRELQWDGDPDEIWINKLTQIGGDWAALTGDRLLQHRELVRQSGLTLFIFDRTWGNLDFWTRSWKTIKAWPDIVHRSVVTREACFP